MNDYIIIDIGCLECEIESKVVGKYTTKKKADKVAAQLQSKHEGYKDHEFKVFEIPSNYS